MVTKEIRKASKSFRAVSHPVRLAMVNYIGKNEPVHVNGIVKAFKMPQALISQQLAKLRSEDIVTSKRDGKQIYCYLNTKSVDQINKVISAINNN